MRIAIIGQQAFGRATLEAFRARGDDVAGVFCAPTKPGAKPDPLAQAAAAMGLPLFQFKSLRSEEAEDAMRSLRVDLGVMAYVLQFAPQSLVTIPKHGTIQYHPSLLPKYRGPSSINWPIINGETHTGLTIFRPTDGLDEGPVILQRTIPIAPDDTLATLYFDHLFPLGVEAMLEAADLVVSGGHREIAQDESRATYEGWCRDAEAEINWNHHVDIVYNLVRGCNSSPGAWTVFAGRKLRLYEARKITSRKLSDVAGKPGEIIEVGERSIKIAAQGGCLDVLKLRLDGEDKMSGGDFAAAHQIRVGARLGGREAKVLETVA